METLGGGKVVETHVKRARRFRPEIVRGLAVREEGTAEASLLALLEDKQPLELSDLMAQSQLPESEARLVIDALIQQGQIVAPGEGEHQLLFTGQGWTRLANSVKAILNEYHSRYPARTGMPKVELGSRLKLGKHAPEIWQKLAGEGLLEEEGLMVRLTGHRVRLTPQQQAQLDVFLKSLEQNPYSPPGDQIPEPDLLNVLIEQQKVVKVSEGVVFAVSVYNEMVERIVAHLKARGKVTLAEVRDLFQTSRKYAQAILEHLDEKRVTRRVGDERVLI